jgi:hypothetical protein
MAVMIQLVLVSVVVPVSVAAVEVRHTFDPPTRFMQMIVRPLVIVDLIAATTLPGPSVWKANVRAAPAALPFCASSRIDVNVIVERFAWGVGEGVGEGDPVGVELPGPDGPLDG